MLTFLTIFNKNPQNNVISCQGFRDKRLKVKSLEWVAIFVVLKIRVNQKYLVYKTLKNEQVESPQ